MDAEMLSVPLVELARSLPSHVTYIKVAANDYVDGRFERRLRRMNTFMNTAS